MTTTVTVDTNAAEAGLYKALEDAYGSEQVLRSRLDLGDVRMQRENGLIFFERKSWADWAASVQDGRYKEQKARFKAVYGDDTSAQYVYLVEGTLTGMSGATRGMQNKALNAAILMTQLRDNIHIIRVPDAEAACHTLIYLYKKFQAGEIGAGASPAINRVVVGAKTGAKARKRANLEDADGSAQLVAMLTQIPSISIDKAEAILNEAKTDVPMCSMHHVRKLLKQRGTVADIKYGHHPDTNKRRRLGKKLEDRLRVIFGVNS